MIYVCEPECKAGSHELGNSGFLHGLYTVYGETTFYAEQKHIQYIKKHLTLRNSAGVNGITFNTIKFPPNIYDFRQPFYYRKIFTGILKRVTDKDKVVFLSTNPMALSVLKKLSLKKEFAHITFNVVLHQGIEDLSPAPPKKNPAAAGKQNNETSASRVRRLLKNNFFTILKKTIKYILNRINGMITGINDYLNKKIFTYADFFNKNDLSRFNFIVLSKHIIDNLRINNSTFRISLFWHPGIFPKNTTQSVNDYPKFGITGHGTDNGLFQETLNRLEELKPSKKYEIRQITKHIYSNIEKYRNITPRRPHFIEREEMEEMLCDIDYLFNFFDADRYRLTCSGSVFDAIANDKPVIYIGNDCYDSFNNIIGESENTDVLRGTNIGIRAVNTADFAAAVYNIIENWEEERKKIEIYKSNISKIKKIIEVSAQLTNDKSIIM